jgi:polyisoprenyl-teichoic acid--peptidoglycan teichoic acid transferase
MEKPKRIHNDDPDVLIIDEPVEQDKKIENKELKSRIFKIVKWVLIAIVGIILAIVLWIAIVFIINTAKVAKGNILGIFANNKLSGEDQGRVNILLAGNSADDGAHGGALLTDSIMILSIDTKNNSAFALSIPRDLWVDVPGYGYEKINAAYEQGGMGLLEQVVDKDFGITMNYYTLVNYTAFKSAVNDVGGIDVVINSPDKRGIYDPNISKVDSGPLVLKNGLVHLDGQTALNLARARNDPTPSGKVGFGLPNGDFDRAANQRLMLVALKNKVFSSTVYANPIKISNLLGAIGSNVKTDFKTNDLQRLYSLVKSINTNNIASLSLTTNSLIKNYTSSDGQSSLIPSAGVSDFSQIQFYIKQQTSSDPVVREGAAAVVLNASGVAGVASTAATKLQGQGIDVMSFGNTYGAYSGVEIVDNSSGKKPKTLAALKVAYPGSTIVTKSSLIYTYPSADFIIIIGTSS